MALWQKAYENSLLPRPTWIIKWIMMYYQSDSDLYNSHHVRISLNARNKRWQPCNWIQFHSLDDEQTTNLALSSANSSDHSNPSVYLKKSSRHNVVLWNQKSKHCSAGGYKVNTSVKSSLGKFSYGHSGELLDPMITETCSWAFTFSHTCYRMTHLYCSK